MANPYQINDGESMASVRSKLNQIGEAVDGAASKEYVDDKSTEVVEEVPAEYVAGKVYFLKDKEWAPKDKSALIALGSNDIVIAELNSHPTEYFEFFNNGTPEGLILYPITGGDGIFVKGTDIKRIAINEGSYNQYAYKNGVWEKIHNGEPA